MPNLPDLGTVPFAQAEYGLPEPLSALTNQHNGLLTAMIAGLREDLEVEIIELDIHTSFNKLLTSGAFPMVAIPCLTQDAFRNRFPTGVCEPPFDVNDVLFWDLLHPTTAAHDVIAMFAFGAVSGMR